MITDHGGAIELTRGFSISDGMVSPGGAWGEYRLPFTFSSNSRPYLKQLATKSGIWFCDVRRPTSLARAVDKTGYFYPCDASSAIANAMTVAKAITASACFPPLFGPMNITNPRISLMADRLNEKRSLALARSIALTDGGVYDNMAIEPVWKKAGTILVSDYGRSSTCLQEP